MRAIDFDDGGAANQDRSIQNGAVCLPPDATITPDDAPYCQGSTHTASAPAGADSYTWEVIGGEILDGQGTATITYQVDADATEVTISLLACETNATCPGSFCCNEDSVTIAVTAIACAVEGPDVIGMIDLADGTIADDIYDFSAPAGYASYSWTVTQPSAGHVFVLGGTSSQT
jgi:hypothetical protein